MFRSRRRQLAVRLVVVVFLFVQLAVPAAGLYLSHANDRGYPFSWHMFSRLERDER